MIISNTQSRGFILVIFFSLFIASCSSINPKDAVYFNTLPEGRVATNTPIPESLIQSNDLLGITINSLNPAASAMFNTSGTTASGTLVGADGNIYIPILGNMKAIGVTKSQLAATITNALIDKKLLIDPVVTIRFLNFRVTVLGEVNNPTVIPVPSEKISLLEAIGEAGDLTFDALRKNVLIIREESGQKTVARVDLNSNEIFSSPYYYLKANDIVYVEPQPSKIRQTTNRTPAWVPLALTGLSIIFSVASLIQ
ncbi:MAG: polysaccharide biosynthesis/export family protein [Chitinophagaceae bacterium]